MHFIRYHYYYISDSQRRHVVLYFDVVPDSTLVLPHLESVYQLIFFFYLIFYFLNVCLFLWSVMVLQCLVDRITVQFPPMVLTFRVRGSILSHLLKARYYPVLTGASRLGLQTFKMSCGSLYILWALPQVRYGSQAQSVASRVVKGSL